MRIVPDGSAVTLEIDLILADGTTSTATAATWEVSDGSVVLATGNASVVSGVATVVISGAANQIGTAQRAGRQVTVFAPEGAVYETYLVEKAVAATALAIPAESGQTLMDAIVLGASMEGLDSWHTAPVRDRVRAMKEAWARIAKLRLRVWREEDQIPAGYDRLAAAQFSLDRLTPDEWATVPEPFKIAVRRAQLLEATRVIEGDPVAERRDEGLLSKTVGEASEMFRSGKPMDFAVGRAARRELAGYIVMTRRIGRA